MTDRGDVQRKRARSLRMSSGRSEPLEEPGVEPVRAEPEESVSIEIEVESPAPEPEEVEIELEGNLEPALPEPERRPPPRRRPPPPPRAPRRSGLEPVAFLSALAAALSRGLDLPAALD